MMGARAPGRVSTLSRFGEQNWPLQTLTANNSAASNWCWQVFSKKALGSVIWIPISRLASDPWDGHSDPAAAWLEKPLLDGPPETELMKLTRRSRAGGQQSDGVGTCRDPQAFQRDARWIPSLSL